MRQRGARGGSSVGREKAKQIVSRTRQRQSETTTALNGQDPSSATQKSTRKAKRRLQAMSGTLTSCKHERKAPKAKFLRGTATSTGESASEPSCACLCLLLPSLCLRDTAIKYQYEEQTNVDEHHRRTTAKANKRKQKLLTRSELWHQIHNPYRCIAFHAQQ